MNGILIGAIMIIVYSIVDGINVYRIKRSKQKIEEDLGKKIELIKKQMNLIEELNEKLQQTGKDLLHLADCGKELSKDYAILCDILIEEIGIDETDKRFNERRNKLAPIDINQFIKKVLQEKKE